jgi:hypothetical protein
MIIFRLHQMNLVVNRIYFIQRDYQAMMMMMMMIVTMKYHFIQFRIIIIIINRAVL